MMPYGCLGSIWSQWDKKDKEHLAPTICVTLTHFYGVVNCVITTCLRDHSMMAQDRARVVGNWVRVARVSHERAQGIPSLEMRELPLLLHQLSGLHSP